MSAINIPAPATSTQYSKVKDVTEEHTISIENPSHQSSGPLKRYSSLLLMILVWTSALAFAIGHHFFYARFDRKRVDQTDLSQGWIIRIGTGMAFAVQVLFVISATIACTQFQWLTTRSREFSVRQVDTIFSVPGNPLAFLQSRLWLRYPALSLLAAVACLLPIAAVVTPATISVVLNQDVTTTKGTPPQLYFDPNQYGNLQTLVRADYLGPSSDTTRTAYGSALTGQILPIPASQSNLTYVLDFIGPAVRCEPASARFINDTYTAYRSQISQAGVENEYHYISWVPIAGKKINLTGATGTTLDVVSTDAAHIYIIPNTSVSGPIYVGGMEITSSVDHFGYQDLLDCSLYNASYTAFFNFSHPQQKIDIRSHTFLNPVNVSSDISQWRFSTKSSPNMIKQQAQCISYQSIMEAFGKLLVGYNWNRDGFTVNEATSWNMLSIDWTSRNATQRGLEELFQNITLSMLSVPALTMNETIAEANQVDIIIYRTFNIYAYTPRDLWLAYSIAGAAAFLCVCAGIYAIWRNGGCYQTNFSTFIRVTKDEVLFKYISSNDSGAEPLPKDLAEVRLMLGG
ncbi:hypothetical protein Vi05172_g7793 [Venturia inaequalis]|nr:hypothetical protein Vi05172_g7793 [Venturia inaequalis]